MTPDAHAIEHFLHGQVDCWNRSDKEGFMAHYRKIAPKGLTLEYVGQPLQGAWAVLENMWERQQPHIRIEVIRCIINGNEAACHHSNNRVNGEPGIQTIEVYRFEDGLLQVRYFVEH
ncbi:nuclear transport factor 2 family protein [Pseudomonas veronii]|uniref:Nuclear transport factor 2 family protein n=1 Tax=Pseudomonas veronii TaxID=76761 RepID=A0A4P7YAW4_PSEVE|nr:nuclear transport factor 2 family protein [Pseudomonas veronii]QCG68145.1 nuclear transport factor 2 family protein [Pseudomonas veronii]